VAGTKSLLDDVELEISLHASLLHGNILRLVEYYRTEKKIFVVMELLTGGELLGALNDRGSFPESDARELPPPPNTHT
jgi:serine/threonine protein kinase